MTDYELSNRALRRLRPWSIAAVAVTARLYIFGIGGYGREEWAYARNLHGKAADWVVGGPARWLETFDFE
ncbi:unnamed protein product [Parascedosporium putredinis]|uniref:Uncharacterized protein n=1 Tax=Parascedosporium putredinis TaxID=1442378 RepID=A0A9P1GZP0_9PEZI|nr:unnamed protein product [Parascedosporium putredinis]CAI7991966.1 unnamed protein product [Parascedosporium putredinis]